MQGPRDEIKLPLLLLVDSAEGLLAGKRGWKTRSIRRGLLLAATRSLAYVIETKEVGGGAGFEDLPEKRIDRFTS